MFRFWEADYLLAYVMALARTTQADFMGPMRVIVTIGPGPRIVRWEEECYEASSSSSGEAT